MDDRGAGRSPMRIGWIAMGMAVLACEIASCGRTPPSPSKPNVTAQDPRAVAVAEAFVRQHGYTDQAADPVVIQEDDEYRSRRDVASGDMRQALLLQLRNGSRVAQAY